ncbi:MAG: TonB-dependent receptor [Dysgonamonadaceae bacterium]|jgi:TonB-linked SusC/RagA family outer membrane protein|nr:TonB-dependent receptor [Dysgonamonadaceae bacterium]
MKKSIFAIVYLFLSFTLLAQNSQKISVSGIVTAGDDGMPLIGASVSVDGTTVGTVTDLDGHYMVEAPSGAKLRFSYIGYKELVKVAPASGKLDVVLETDAHVLDEVVAIGYGSMKRSDLTGAISSVKADQLQKTPAPGLDQALQGRAAGVTVISSSGQPGAAAQVRIRGIGTVLSDSSPIYVVDGIITSDISFLSPNDIQSTEILKDASSSAIYGSRGANGVILVTTKSGVKNGDGKISFNSYYGVQNRWHKLDLMKSKEYTETMFAINAPADEKKYYNKNGFNAWLAAYRTGGSPYYPVIQTKKNPEGLDYSAIETDWQDEVFHANAPIQSYHLSIEGGNEKNQYSLSGNYIKQDGTIIGSNYERLTIRANSSSNVRKWLKVGENISLAASKGRNAMNNDASPGASVLSAALAMAPWDPTHYPEGSYNLDGKDLSGQIAASSNFRDVMNPFSMVDRIHPEDKVERWVGDVWAEIMPLKYLKLRSSVGLDLTNIRSKIFRDAYMYSSYDYLSENSLISSMSRGAMILWENTVTWAQTIDKHDFTVMFGQTAEEYNYYSISGSGERILVTSPENWYLSKTTYNQQQAGDGVDRTRMFSLLGRAHYVYNNRYLATFSFRQDSSSKFPKYPTGYFPSAGLAWRVSEESFMKDITPIDYLKVRLGWGKLGNEKVGQSSFQASMFNSGPTYVDYILGLTPDYARGAAILSMANEDGRWEVTEQWDLGIDFGLFNNALIGTIDLFRRDTQDMILTLTSPSIVGNRFYPSANTGTMRNQGIELSLDHQRKIGDVNYSVGGNVSFIKNKILKLNGGDRVWGDRWICDEGLPVFTFFAYEYEGIYQSDEEANEALWGYQKEGKANPYQAGDAKYADLDNDGQITSNDRKTMGNPFPWLTYGLNLSANYKGFDLELFFQGVYGNELYNALRIRTENTGLESALSTKMSDVWTEDNPNGTIPNPTNSLNLMKNEATSRFIESGAYFRLKNIQFGYTLPKPITRNWQIERLRFYIQGSNLLTLTGYTGYDPELPGGVDYGNYPQARTLLFGVNVDF